jgi:hypothetical protein
MASEAVSTRVRKRVSLSREPGTSRRSRRISRSSMTVGPSLRSDSIGMQLWAPALIARTAVSSPMVSDTMMKERRALSFSRAKSRSAPKPRRS